VARGSPFFFPPSCELVPSFFLFIDRFFLFWTECSPPPPCFSLFLASPKAALRTVCFFCFFFGWFSACTPLSPCYGPSPRLLPFSGFWLTFPVRFPSPFLSHFPKPLSTPFFISSSNVARLQRGVPFDMSVVMLCPLGAARSCYTFCPGFSSSNSFCPLFPPPFCSCSKLLSTGFVFFLLRCAWNSRAGWLGRSRPLVQVFRAFNFCFLSFPPHSCLAVCRKT